MMTADRALALNAENGKMMPKVDAFAAIYAQGVRPRHGEVIMIAGRSGSGKSGFAMYWAAQMGLPTLYFSADMNASTASRRMATMAMRETAETVEQYLTAGGADRERCIKALAEYRNMTFSFGSPLSWQQVDEELEAYVHLHNQFPGVIVLDNLMDFEGAESDYAGQMATMSNVTELARYTGATVFILHHATDKGWQAVGNPWQPPSRDQIKGGMSEKPELILTVALMPEMNAFNVACVKQRSGPTDPMANRYATIKAIPEFTSFAQWSDDDEYKSVTA